MAVREQRRLYHFASTRGLKYLVFLPAPQNYVEREA